jgi:hypothetical protein
MVLDGIDMAQDRDKLQVHVNTVVYVCIQQNSRNFLTGWGTVSLSGRNLLQVVG